MEVKTILIYLVLNYELSLTTKNLSLGLGFLYGPTEQNFLILNKIKWYIHFFLFYKYLLLLKSISLIIELFLVVEVFLVVLAPVGTELYYVCLLVVFLIFFEFSLLTILKFLRFPFGFSFGLTIGEVIVLLT